jgi:hypothetical protein
VIRYRALKSTLRRHLREQTRKFSLDVFLEGIHAIAARFLKENGKRPF